MIRPTIYDLSCDMSSDLWYILWPMWLFLWSINSLFIRPMTYDLSYDPPHDLRLIQWPVSFYNAKAVYKVRYRPSGAKHLLWRDDPLRVSGRHLDDLRCPSTGDKERKESPRDGFPSPIMPPSTLPPTLLLSLAPSRLLATLLDISLFS